jgi:putative transposase
MPGRNIVKQYGSEQYYHVYSRGVAKQPVFLDDQDYLKFLSLFKRYLSFQPERNPDHGYYPHYGNRLRLLAYCLMPNHFHLLIYQVDESAMREFMKALLASYGMYFNKKYRRVGPIFQSRYRASLINKDSYLDHISRYIHLNPVNWQQYPYSSLSYFMDQARAEWIYPNLILDLFPSRTQYLEFINDYESYKEMIEELRWELADS